MFVDFTKVERVKTRNNFLSVIMLLYNYERLVTHVVFCTYCRNLREM